MTDSDGVKVEPATIGDLLERTLPERQLVVETAKGQRSLTMRSLTQDAFDRLVAAHPAKPDQKDAIGRPKRWNPDTFGPALVAACLVEPVLAVEEVRRLWSAWNPADVDALFATAFDLCEERGVEELGKALPDSGPTPSTDSSPTGE